MTQEALKLALEALESGVKTTANRISWTEYDCELMEQAITAIKEALAQPEQEPVALKVYRGELCYKSQEDDQSFGMWCPVTEDLPFPEGTKFYTTPPQRTWVGLTDREIDDLYCEHHDEYGCQLSATGYERAIEAKLMEKNA
jgi:hypothetical protein